MDIGASLYWASRVAVNECSVNLLCCAEGVCDAVMSSERCRSPPFTFALR